MSQKREKNCPPPLPPIGRAAQGSISLDGCIDSAGLQNTGGGACNGASPGNECASSMVASAIQALPLDVGTAISPTLSKHSAQRANILCSGGPGNLTCGLEVKNNQQGMQCDLCLSWFHALCQDVSKTAYNALTKHASLAFICHGCKRLPQLEKLNPRKAKEAATQTIYFSAVRETNTDALPVDSVTRIDSSVQAGSPRAENDSIPTQFTDSGRGLPQLVDRVTSLEKSLTEHTALLSRVLAEQEHGHHTGNIAPNTSGKRPTFSEVVKVPGSQQQGGTIPKAFDPNPPSRAPLRQSSSGDYRRAVREELQELEERRKRRASLVIRGLQVSSSAEAVTKFKSITQHLIGESVELSEVCRIRNDADLFRGNVHDPRLRRQIIDHARELKDSRYSGVYIRRDLTFQQREELKARCLENPDRSYSYRAQGVAPSQARSNYSTQQHAPQCQETVPKSVWVPSDRNRTRVDTSHPEPEDSRPTDKAAHTDVDTRQNTIQGDLHPSNQTSQSEDQVQGAMESDDHTGDDLTPDSLDVPNPQQGN